MRVASMVVCTLLMSCGGGTAPLDEDAYWQQVAPEICRIGVLCGDITEAELSDCVAAVEASERDPDCFDGAAAAACVAGLQGVTSCESSGPAFGQCEDVYAFENCPDQDTAAR